LRVAGAEQLAARALQQAFFIETGWILRHKAMPLLSLRVVYPLTPGFTHWQVRLWPLWGQGVHLHPAIGLRLGCNRVENHQHLALYWGLWKQGGF
jgi:hypothetical protein